MTQQKSARGGRLSGFGAIAAMHEREDLKGRPPQQRAEALLAGKLEWLVIDEHYGVVTGQRCQRLPPGLVIAAHKGGPQGELKRLGGETVVRRADDDRLLPGKREE